jgi:hypothetical protein
MLDRARGRIAAIEHCKGMATFSNPTLSITPIPNNTTHMQVVATVTVTTAHRDNRLLELGVPFRLKCQLCEQDANDQEVLFGFPRQLVTAGTKVYTFSEQVRKDALDQEPGPEEIFARFMIRVVKLPAPIHSPKAILHV